MKLTPDEEVIKDDALVYARKNKKTIARRLTDIDRFTPEEEPVSVFMAGSPGAGKTEASIELLANVEESGFEILRIDPDELRNELPNYKGTNSNLFQPAVSVLVEKTQITAISYIKRALTKLTTICQRNILAWTLRVCSG